MSVYINFKICDNAKECSGIAVCPATTLYWDALKSTVAINADSCLACDACVAACPAGAIRVAHNEEEALQIQQDIENDPRTIKDLMVERYGASPVSDKTLISVKEAVKIINEQASLLAIEVISGDDTPCLINSVPISEAFGSVCVEYRKITVGDDEFDIFEEKYAISTCPALLVFKSGVLLVRIDGVVENSDYRQRTEFIHKIRSSIQ